VLTTRSAGSLRRRTMSTWRSAWKTPPTTAPRAVTVNLVVVFLFALTALVFLTRTAVCAKQVDDSVAMAINPQTTGIAQHTVLVRKLDRTVAGTDALARIVQPYPGYASDAVAAMDSIRADSAGTDDSVAAIERSVRGIDQSVTDMQGPVARLGAGVGDIHSRSATITAALTNTADLTTAMVADIGSSDASLTRILRVLSTLNPVTDGIQRDLHAIGIHTGNIANNGVIRLGNVYREILNGLVEKP
jgi:hypothetical protein